MASSSPRSAWAEFREVLADQSRHELVRLSNRDRERFLEMLDKPAAPNAALIAAAKKHRKRVA